MTKTTTDPGAPPAGPAPDHPPVPRAGRSRAATVLAVVGTLVVGGYAAIAYTEVELGSPARSEIPVSVRSSPGGYRQFHFWHSGYHGGK